MFCTSCGKELVDQWNFCENCGVAVEQDSSPSVEQDSPPSLDNREVTDERRARMIDTIRSRPMDEGTRAQMIGAIEKGKLLTELEETQRPTASRIDFGQAVKLGIQNTFVFDARSTPAEYWWWFLFAAFWWSLAHS